MDPCKRGWGWGGSVTDLTEISKIPAHSELETFTELQVVCEVILKMFFPLPLIFVAISYLEVLRKDPK